VAIYSISDLEKLTNIKAHTLRIWEQRYGIVCPTRTEGNARCYCDEDLKYLLNVAVLRRNGQRISKIVTMSRSEIFAMAKKLSDVDSPAATQLDALILSMMEMDEVKFDHLITRQIEQHGFEHVMLEVIYPFLEKLSVLWITGSINAAQEYFIGNLIRQKLITAIDQVPPVQSPKAKKIILFLFEGENQELSLLFTHYLIKKHGHKVIYLGCDISLGDLNSVNDIIRPDFIYTMMMNEFASSSLKRILQKLEAQFPETKMLIGAQPGQFEHEKINYPNCKFLSGFVETTQFFAKLT